VPRKKRSDTTYEQEPHEPDRVMETRVFKSGNSYAVRIPKPLYSSGEASVYIRKLAGGKLLVTPREKAAWPRGFFASFGNLPADFEAPARPAADEASDALDAALFSESEG
jgi:virulence-associated protein VagC